MDLSQLDTTDASNDGVDFHPHHPATGEALDSVVTLAGTDSDVYQRESNAIKNRNMKRLVSGGRIHMKAEAMDAEALELLARCTLGWKNIELDGEKLPHSTENAVLLYKRLPWLREQVDEFIGDRANFFGKPSKRSVSTQKKSSG